MQIWTFIQDKLSVGESVMLIVVAHTEGSSPGKKGFKMAVASGGGVVGSVGGGLMEYNMVELARERLKKGGSPFLKRLVHSPEAEEDASGLICEGEQHLVFVPLHPGDKERITLLASHVDDGNGGELVLSSGGFAFHSKSDCGTSDEGLTISEQDWKYVETMTPVNTMYLFGGGHISVPLSQLGRMLGFRMVVLDDRQDLDTMKNNPYAHDKKRINYLNAAACIDHPENSYAAIMSVSHENDQLILEQLLPLPLKYLGMIGSKAKIKRIFDNLLDKGFGQDELNRVDAPMGMDINSLTPAEIAVSIYSLIIKRKNA